MRRFHPTARMVLATMVKSGKNIDSWLKSMGITDETEVKEIKRMFGKKSRVINTRRLKDGYETI